MTTSSAPSRPTLLAPAGGVRTSEAQRRRYQLARLRVASLRQDTSGPFEHLKRGHD